MEKQKNLRLSRRLLALCGMVTPGHRLCDVGCDHALVPLYLLEQGLIPSALAMDVAEGPLRAAAANLAAHGEVARGLTDGKPATGEELKPCLSDEKSAASGESVSRPPRVELRLSDGLDDYRPGEAQTLLIAGMGGLVIRSILTREPDKTRSFRELILEPQSEAALVRAALRELGAGICDEVMVEEDGKFYPIIRAVPGTAGVRPDWDAAQTGTVRSAVKSDIGDALARPAAQFGSGEMLTRSAAKSGNEAEADAAARRRLEDAYGPALLQKRDGTLRRFLEWRRQVNETVRQSLTEAVRADSAGENQAAAQTRRLARLRELQAERADLEAVLALFAKREK